MLRATKSCAVAGRWNCRRKSLLCLLTSSLIRAKRSVAIDSWTQCGATRTIQTRGLLTLTLFTCGRNWKRILKSRVLFLQFMAAGISLSDEVYDYESGRTSNQTTSQRAGSSSIAFRCALNQIHAKGIRDQA